MRQRLQERRKLIFLLYVARLLGALHAPAHGAPLAIARRAIRSPNAAIPCGNMQRFFWLCLTSVDIAFAPDTSEILAKSAEHRASGWPVSSRGSLLIARGRKADNLTYSYPRSLNRAFFFVCLEISPAFGYEIHWLCLTSVDIAFAPDVWKFRLIACGL